MGAHLKSRPILEWNLAYNMIRNPSVKLPKSLRWWISFEKKSPCLVDNRTLQNVVGRWLDGVRGHISWLTSRRVPIMVGHWAAGCSTYGRIQIKIIRCISRRFCWFGSANQQVCRKPEATHREWNIIPRLCGICWCLRYIEKMIWVTIVKHFVWVPSWTLWERRCMRRFVVTIMRGIWGQFFDYLKHIIILRLIFESVSEWTRQEYADHQRWRMDYGLRACYCCISQGWFADLLRRNVRYSKPPWQLEGSYRY